jgi:hypothetical protein
LLSTYETAEDRLLNTEKRIPIRIGVTMPHRGYDAALSALLPAEHHAC